MKRTTIITLLLFAFTYTISGKSLYINELMPSNVYGIMDELYDFPDSWVEIYNDSEADINIKGYSFAESTKNKVKWVIPVDCIVPAKGFKLVYFDKADTGLHAGFRLDINGGKLYLYDPATALVDYITYDKTNPDLSFGRVSDGGSDWGLLTRSTPGESNKNSQIAAGICAAPNFNNNNTFYTNQAIFRVTNNEPGSYMVYTTDGSEPREDGKVLNASLKLTESRVCKVKVFKEGYAPSPTVTKTFLINMRQTELPIISLGMDSKHLKDDMIGIYVIGKNGVVDNCYDDPRNYNQPWRRPMTFEYFERSHVSEPELNQTGELRIAGGCSRNNDQKTVILYANKRFRSEERRVGKEC